MAGQLEHVVVTGIRVANKRLNNKNRQQKYKNKRQTRKQIILFGSQQTTKQQKYSQQKYKSHTRKNYFIRVAMTNAYSDKSRQ